MARRNHYHVYVVELSQDMLLNARFIRSNPGSPGPLLSVANGLEHLKFA